MTEIFTKDGVSLDRLQTLAKVVQAGSIVQAAKGEPTTQSLISRQLTELEQALGVVLLDRTKKPYQPTQVARRLAETCERFVREVADVSLGENVKKSIKVGAGEWVIRELLVPLIGKQSKQLVGVSWMMHNLTSQKIQEGLAADRLDVGVASNLITEGAVQVKELPSYGMRLLLPAGETPDKRGWKRLTTLPVVVLEGHGAFRKFLADCEKTQGIQLQIGAECTSYPQAIDLAKAAGWAVFVPELGWKQREEWAKRNQKLPGLDGYRHTLHLGWNARNIQRRPEVAKLVEMLGGKK
jgi:DNA-binding transcriptional LysR family regulator